MRLLFHRYVISTTEYFFRYQSKPAFIWRWYFFVLFSDDEPHGFHFAAVLCPIGDDIDSSGVDIRMAEYIRQLRHIVVDTVKRPGKKVPETMRKHFRWGNLRPFA